MMNPVFNLVFDIDGTLAVEDTFSPQSSRYLEKTGHIVTALKTHFVFPGVVELMQLLFKMPDVKVSFFSSGPQDRNELFVAELLKRALGEEQYHKVKNEIRICSGKKNTGDIHGHGDLTRRNEEKQMQQKNLYGDWLTGARKKCLRKIIGEDGELENTILIDDAPSYIMYEQERNLFYLPEIELDDFHDPIEPSTRFDLFDLQGLKIIPFVKRSKIFPAEVLDTDFICILFSADSFKLHFRDIDEKKINEITIFKETNEEIFNAAKHYYCKTNISPTTTETGLTKTELDDYFYDLINKNNGKTKKIQFEYNRIYYLAGMIFKALKAARAGSTLTQFFFPLHFTPTEDQKFSLRYRSKDAEHLREEHYHYGLKKLRKANQDLTFVIPEYAFGSGGCYAASSSPASST